MTKKVPIREDTFIATPDGGALLGNKCESCGEIFFPKAQFCLSCFQEDMEGIVLSRQGKLHSYTISFVPSAHFDPPYAVGYVDMPEGVRILAPLELMEGKPFRIGMQMEVLVEKLWQEGDKEVIGYKFRAV